MPPMSSVEWLGIKRPFSISSAAPNSAEDTVRDTNVASHIITFMIPVRGKKKNIIPILSIKDDILVKI